MKVKISSLKQLGFFLALIALTTTQTVFANDKNDAKVAISQYINDLNVVLLFIQTPSCNNRAPVTRAYNEDVRDSAIKLQEALRDLGGRTEAEIANAFLRYAHAIEGINKISIEDAKDELAHEIHRLKPNRIGEREVIDQYLNPLTEDLLKIKEMNFINNFKGAIKASHSAEQTAQDLVKFIINQID